MKLVLHDPKVQTRFLNRVKEEIEKKEQMTPLNRKNFWRIIKKSRFPVFLGILVTFEGTMELVTGQAIVSWISFFRTGIFYAVTTEEMNKGGVVVRNEIV